MASEEPPLRLRRQPPAKPQPPPPTTIRDLGDDLILEIFLRLPSLASLVRAALACRAFLAAVRSSPNFRRRFCALRGRPVLGIFLHRNVTDVHSYAPIRRRSDPDLAAAVRASDVFLNRVPDFLACAGWLVADCRGGFVLLLNLGTRQVAAYSPLTRALDLFPALPEVGGDGRLVHHRYNMVTCDEAPGSFRVVSLCRHRSELRAAVFSSGTREWQILPWTGGVPAPQLDGVDRLCTGAQVERCVYWTHADHAYSIVLDTATLQLSSIDLPAHLKGQGDAYRTGQTKDGKLCIVHAVEFTLSIWFRRADADGVDRWMLDSVIPLEGEIRRATNCSLVHRFLLRVWAILDGIVYLSTFKSSEHVTKPYWFLSFCLETRKLEKLFYKTADSDFYPYIMAWPPALLGNN
ncbi:unnamed protein product [Urochloa humidicola]